MEKKKNLGAAPVGVQGEQRKRKKMPSPGWGAGRVRVNGERRGERGEKREKCGEKSLELGGKRRKIGGWWGGPNGVLGKREKSGRKKIEGKMKSGPVVRSMGGERRSDFPRDISAIYRRNIVCRRVSTRYFLEKYRSSDISAFIARNRRFLAIYRSFGDKSAIFLRYIAWSTRVNESQIRYSARQRATTVPPILLAAERI